MDAIEILKNKANESQFDFSHMSNLIDQIAGSLIPEDRKLVIKSQLLVRINALKLNGFEGYLQFLQKQSTESIYWSELLSIITQKEAEFFLNSKHIEFLALKFIPEWVKTDQQTVMVWLSGASSGEDAYTLAMVLKKYLPDDKDFKIIATDSNLQMLKVGMNGVYPLAKLDKIPLEFRDTNITMGSGTVSNWFCIKTQLKEKISFKHFSLMKTQNLSEDKFDLVFCGNSAGDTLNQVVVSLQEKLKTDGYFFLGNDKSLRDADPVWTSVEDTIYKLNI
ncbi:MAG: CheR family methyltransferase [Pseudobdellovibrio sp.]